MRKLAKTGLKRDIDRHAQVQFGFPAMVLMEHAARSCWQKLRNRFEKVPCGLLVVAVGPGNNGGDGLALARMAAEDGCRVVVLHSGSSWRDLPAQQLRMLQACERVRVIDWAQATAEAREALQAADYVVDALFGVGLSRPLSGAYAAITAEVNTARSHNCRMKIVSVDLPSGMLRGMSPQDSCIMADITLAVTPADTLLYIPAFRYLGGEILHVDAGFPRRLIDSVACQTLLDTADIDDYTVALPVSAYKSSRGHVCIYGGSVQYHGAVVLASQAAGCTTAGRVTTAVDPAIDAVVRTHLLSAVIQSHSDNPPAGVTALLAGSGWGSSADRPARLQELLQLSLPVVIDGEGLRALYSLQHVRREHDAVNWVLTPHPGELALLADMTVEAVLQSIDTAAELVARKYRAVVVAKSHVTCILHPDVGVFWIDGLEPALGTAGSGDVLAGMIAGELASDGDPLRAAAYSVLLHLQAGRNLHQGTAEQLVYQVGSLVRDNVRRRKQ